LISLFKDLLFQFPKNLLKKDSFSFSGAGTGMEDLHGVNKLLHWFDDWV